METSPTKKPQEKTKKPVSQRESRIDTIIAFSCILSSFVILRLANDSALWNQMLSRDASGISAGNLVREQGRVRHKPVGSAVWHDVPGRELPVAYGDTIFTGDDGVANLQLSGGRSGAQIQPNSLIVVRQPSVSEEKGQWLSSLVKVVVAPSSPDVAVEIKSGKVKLDLVEGSAPVQLQSQGKVLELKSETKGGGSVEVATNPSDPTAPLEITPDAATQVAIMDMKAPKAAPIRVESGKTAVVSDSAPTKVETAKVVPPSSKAPVAATAPKAVDADGRREVTLSWEGIEKENIGQGAVLEIDGAERKTIAIKGSAKAGRVQLKEGRYKWRLKTLVDGEVVRTSWNQFAVGDLPPPTIRAPLNETVLFAKAGGETAVAFKWEDLPSKLKVEVEVLAANGTSANAESRTTSVAMNFKSGTYRWKARVLTSDGKMSAWTGERRFLVKDEAVKAAASAQKETAMALFTPGAAVTEAPAQILKSIAPPIPVVEKTVETIKVPEPPKIAVEAPKDVAKKIEAPKKVVNPFKVQALLGVDEKGKAVEAVKPAAPSAAEVAKADAQKKSAQLASSDSATKAQTRLTQGASLKEIPVLLKWAPIAGVKVYLLEIFNSKNEKLHEETVKEAKGVFKIRSLAESNYNYQISAELPSGEKVSSGLAKVEFEFSPPVCKAPAQNAQITLGKPALLIWEKTALTDFYLLQISTDPGFKRLTVEKQSTKNVEPVVGLKAGNYFWRVKSVTQSKQSDWSIPSRFSVK